MPIADSFWFAQQTTKSSDFWSKLLGIDRVRTDGGEISISWHNMPPLWVLILVIIPAVLLLIWLIYRNERRDVGAVSKGIMTALRSLLLLTVILMLMGPVLTVETWKYRKAYLLVLVDESRSMKKSDPIAAPADKLAIAKVTGIGEKDPLSPAEEEAIRKLTRAEIVRKVLENPKLRLTEQLEEKINVAYFTFSSGASVKESKEKLLEDYRAENCLGTETAIGDAIKAALNHLKGQNIAGVVVFSDGRNNVGMAPREIAAQLKQRWLPIYTVAPGIPHPQRDILLGEIEARDAILANDKMEIAFKIKGEKYENEQVEIDLYAYPLKEKEVPSSTPHELERLIAESKKEQDQSVKLTGRMQSEKMIYNPKTPGEYLLILKVDPRPDENTAGNNYLVHRLRVADDKIRVLYVQHFPEHTYRFLSKALIRDPKILAHCLLTSADDDFPQEHTKADDELFQHPLKEFPRDMESLLKFDVIIYGDVDPEKLGPDAPKLMQSFVNDFGGGLIFISGTMHNPKSLMNTALANLLPVIPDELRDPYESEKIYVQTYGYRLTPAGKDHPITTFKEFEGSKERKIEFWEDNDQRGDGLEPIRWFQHVKKVKLGATPLVNVATGDPDLPPLFVIQFSGQGRVFWCGTDETRLWRHYVGDYPWFYPFWQQAMYWVREGKLIGARRFRVYVDRGTDARYTPGEDVKIAANAYDQKFEALQDPALEIQVVPPVGDPFKVTLKNENRPGYYEGKFVPRDTGRYTVIAGEDESTQATAKFSVYIPDREEDNPIIDEVVLNRELAQESDGGKYFPISQIGELQEVVQAKSQKLGEIREDDLWDSPLVFLIFALLITTEWILRKVFRML